MMRRFRLSAVCFLLAVLMVFCTACSSNNQNVPAEDAFYIYYIELGKSELYPVEGILDSSVSDENMVESIFFHMKNGGDEANYTSAVPKNIELRSYRIDAGNLIMDFNSEYQNLEKKEEVLFRAALAKTFTQFEQIATVEIRIEGQPLMLSDSYVVGPQRGSEFVDIIGSGLSSYTRTEAVLYFSDESGTMLVERTRTLTYSNATTLESQVVNSLIAGPDAEDTGAFRTIPEGTKCLSVNLNGGVCYVNMSENLLDGGRGVSPEVCIYSIVNSLIELSGINSVQISVNGDSNIIFMDLIDLKENLKQNLDIIRPEESSEKAQETGGK